MVKLEQIKRDGYDITCAVFVEDCKEPVQLTYSILDETVQHDPLPEGYEYCTSHIGHAQRALERMVKEGYIEPRTTVMWY